MTTTPPTDRDGVAGDGVVEAVRDAYDAVYDALSHSKTFNDIWRANAYRGEFPEAFAHIGFLTLDEGGRLLDLVDIDEGDVLADLACGAGGPGLWVADQTGATLIGVDASSAGVRAATTRAEGVGLTARASFHQGTFEQTGLPDGAVDAVMTIEAFQYAPDKRAAFAEFHRIVRPGGRVAMVCFEVDAAKVDGVPVLGVDAISDYAPLLAEAGFAIDAYEETPDWESRVYGAFSALVEAGDELTADIGERAAAGALAEALLTIQLRPYPRRVLVVAHRS